MAGAAGTYGNAAAGATGMIGAAGATGAYGDAGGREDGPAARRQQEQVKKGKLFFVHTILLYWPATLTTVFGAAGDRGVYYTAGASGALGRAGPTGM